ncbi:hypothetical protein BGZ83_000501 [Gryganskiella cystojenkinii]|nr:hypothetical protein BGZ83_000501 [Gryganskiella cystojenkinii]
MPKASFKSVLGITELLEHIVQYLCPIDISQLMQTHKQANLDLLPYLWQHIPATLTGAISMSPMLMKNVHLIHSIDLDIPTTASAFQLLQSAFKASSTLQQSRDNLLWAEGRSHKLTVIPEGEDQNSEEHLRQVSRCGLRRLNCAFDGFTTQAAPIFLDFDPDEDDEYVDWDQYTTNCGLVELIRISPLLTHLTLYGKILLSQSTAQTGLLDCLALTLPNLEHLTVTLAFKDPYVPVETALVFLARSLELPNLVELHCDFEIPIGEVEDDSDTDDEPKDRLSLFRACLSRLQRRPRHRIPRRLKSLTLPRTVWPLDFLVPFFRDCVKGIEALDVPWIDLTEEQTRTLLEFEEALRQSSPAIQHVHSCLLRQRNIESVALEAIMRASESGPGLKSFSTWDGMIWTEERFPDLLIKHRATLEVVVADGLAEGDAEFVKVIKSCKNLKVLYAPWFENRTVMEAVVNENVEWACLRLKSLCLCLGMPVHYQGLVVEESYRHLKSYYENVAKLTELEDWTLGYAYNGHRAPISLTDLTLGDGNSGGGFLHLLTGLKNLRRLCLWHDFWTRMGVEEVRFMATHWPQLESITFRTNDIVWLEQKVLKEYAWRELSRLLPKLEYRFLESPVDDADQDTNYN